MQNKGNSGMLKESKGKNKNDEKTRKLTNLWENIREFKKTLDS
jgi:hypothetical protein